MLFGEFYALSSALFYGLSGLTIIKAAENRRGDGGVFISILMTALCTGCFYLATSSAPFSSRVIAIPAIWLFVVAGLLSTVLARAFMFQATVLLGAVGASLWRRTIPLFAIPFSLVLVNDWPAFGELIGGLVIGLGLLLFSINQHARWSGLGAVFGFVSSACYALAYVVRKIGLEVMPDPFLAAFIGAFAGVICYAVWILSGQGPLKRLTYLIQDRGRWFMVSALFLSLGQILQFMALNKTSVTVVALIGALDVVFTAVFAGLLFKQSLFKEPQFVLSIILLLLGTVIFVLG